VSGVGERKRMLCPGRYARNVDSAERLDLPWAHLGLGAIVPKASTLQAIYVQSQTRIKRRGLKAER
jgi:hypothetical protein